MSHMWMRMPGQSWPGAEAAFVGMWIVMTAAMMLPSLIPTLLRERVAIREAGESRVDALITLVTMGYFFVWTVLGAVVYPIGVALSAIQMQQLALARLAPSVIGGVITIAGVLQLSAWKARRLARCRETLWCGDSLRLSASTAWRHGLRLGVDCVFSCAGAMAILLVVGMMDPRAMAVVTAAITIERVTPAGARVARVSGAFAVWAGLVLIARAVTP